MKTEKCKECEWCQGEKHWGHACIHCKGTGEQEQTMKERFDIEFPHLTVHYEYHEEQNATNEVKDFIKKEIELALQKERKRIDNLAQRIIPHTPLKLSETPGRKYDEGYIDYQDHVLSKFRDFIEAINNDHE